MKRIVVQTEGGDCRIALFHNGRLVEYDEERRAEPRLINNIYKGRVVNVLPGMQAAFVDIGLAKNAYLHIDDCLHPNLQKQPEIKPSIEDVLQVGQELIVQLKKEPIGGKGARVTTHILLPGRWAVLMPHADYVAVSRKIQSAEERQRLTLIGERIRRGEEGLIVRTVAEGQSEEAVRRDLERLRRLWASLLSAAAGRSAPALLYRDLGLIPRLVRDVITDEVDELITDDEAVAGELTQLLRESGHEAADRIKIKAEPPGLFERHGVTEALKRVFQRQIPLPSGGYIVVDETEALTAVDVNTGKFTGSVDLEQTVYETNREAAEEIARLLRVRDIGGIVVIDFIDMGREEHRNEIKRLLEALAAEDRSRTIAVGWTKLGLFEMTRKKVRRSLDGL